MKSIVEAIGSKNRGLTRQEVLAKTGIANSGEFSNNLKALISGSFIIKYCSFGSSKREECYKLVDPFCIFYLRFVKGTIPGRNLSWINIADSGMVNAWKGYAFENVCCYAHLLDLTVKKHRGFSPLNSSFAFVNPYLEKLKRISETDDNRVVRIHCLGTIKATGAE